jgi:hypothetical protein
VSRFAGPLAVIGVVVLSVAFASRNGAERVMLDFGLFVLYGVPVTLVAFVCLFLGMLVMLGAGIQSDLKVRSILRQRLAEEDGEELDLVDQSQRDLFLHAPPPERGESHGSHSVRQDILEPPSAQPPDPVARPAEHPVWRDMEHGDPMD